MSPELMTRINTWVLVALGVAFLGTAAVVAGCRAREKIAGSDPAPLPSAAPLTRFWEDGKFGFKDSSGKVVVKPIYDDAGEFSCGLARVNIGRKIRLPLSVEEGRWGYINVDGRVVIPIALQGANDFSEGLALVSDEQGQRYIDTNGKTAIPLEKMAYAGDFSEGVAPIRIWMNKDCQTKFIDKRGDTVLAVDGWAEEFHDGLAVFIVEDESFADSNEKHRYGFISRDGKVAIGPQFAEAKAFHEGMAAVRPKKTTVYGMGDSWGYIDKQGQYILKPQFNEAHPFRNGIARVHVGGKLQERLHTPPYWEGGEWQLVDRKGNVLRRSKDMMEYGQGPVPGT